MSAHPELGVRVGLVNQEPRIRREHPRHTGLGSDSTPVVVLDRASQSVHSTMGRTIRIRRHYHARGREKQNGLERESGFGEVWSLCVPLQRAVSGI